MKRMREIFAIYDQGWMARFEVSDGMTQFGYDSYVRTVPEYLEARAKAVEDLRERMAEHMIAESDLVELRPPTPNLRPDWLPE